MLRNKISATEPILVVKTRSRGNGEAMQDKTTLTNARRTRSIRITRAEFAMLLSTVAQAHGALHSGCDGSCMWTIDADGNMVVRPIPGMSGCLQSGFCRGWGSVNFRHKESIRTMRFERGVCAGDFYSLALLAHDCPNLQSVDVSNIKITTKGDHITLICAFARCPSLKTVTGLDEFDTSKVWTLNEAFRGCASLECVDFSQNDLANVGHATELFAGCTSLRSVNFAGSGFGPRYGFANMFCGCEALESLSYDESFPAWQKEALPTPTADNGMWWSAIDGKWMSVDKIVARGACADTLTNHIPA